MKTPPYKLTQMDEAAISLAQPIADNPIINEAILRHKRDNCRAIILDGLMKNGQLAQYIEQAATLQNQSPIQAYSNYVDNIADAILHDYKK
jgi:hypothetical protein